MNVKVGSAAPKVELEAYRRGEPEPVPFCLDGPRERWLVLFFYPRDFTFVCPTELAAFAELEPAFRDEEADVVAASTDSYWSHKAWFESNAQIGAVNFPIVADTAQQLSFDFGVLTEDGSALRGTSSSTRPGSSGTRASPTRASAAARTRRCACCRRCARASCARSPGSRGRPS